MKKAIAVIGEGITEKYYIESLKGISPFDIRPQELGKKASSLNKLEANIKNSIIEGYDEVYCLIDMDGKQEGNIRVNYANLKLKYHNKIHGKIRNGIQCKVFFIETERCTELWFLYHFTKTVVTRKFNSYQELEKELRKYRPRYEKTEKYFRSVSNIHTELTKKAEPQGSLRKAIANAEESLISKVRDNRDYSYSEIHLLFEALKIEIN
ncbi:MAG: RloB domain-containing protein [Bacteroidales bacterium]|nr:RloB domain-containing protein [Bacteroidales bacterium]